MSDLNDEDGEEELILPSPDSGWIPVATKVDGHITWEDGWQAIESLVDNLRFLQEIPSHEPEWDRLLHGLVALQPLRECRFPLNDFSDFDEMECFLNIHHSNLWGTSDHLFFDDATATEEKTALLQECEELVCRLRRYEPLQQYWQYMS